MHEMILRAGMVAWPTLFLSVLALAVSLRGLVVAATADRRLRTVGAPAAALVLVALVGASGLFGYLLGLHQVEQVVATVSPADRAAVEAMGRDEAAQNLILAAIGALPLVLGCLGVVIGATRQLDGPRPGP